MYSRTSTSVCTVEVTKLLSVWRFHNIGEGENFPLVREALLGIQLIMRSGAQQYERQEHMCTQEKVGNGIG